MSFNPATRVAYTGTPLPEDSDTETLFDTTTLKNPFHQGAGIKEYRMSVDNDEAGTIKAYKSEDHGATWIQVDQLAVAAASATVQNEYVLVVEAFENFKVDWVNGGTTQTSFNISQVLSDERS